MNGWMSLTELITLIPSTVDFPLDPWAIDAGSASTSGSAEPPTIAAIVSAVTWRPRCMTGLGKSSKDVRERNSQRFPK